MIYEDRIETIENFKRLQIPQHMLAAAAEVKPARLSDFLKHRPLTTDKSDRIKDAASKITFIWDEFQSVLPKIRILIDDPNELDRLFAACQAHELEKQLAALAEVTERSLVPLSGK